MASIVKRGINSWRLTVELGYDPEGNRIRKTKTIKVDDESLLRTTKRLKDYLDTELAKFKIEVESGEYISPEKMNFAGFVDQWKNKFVLKELEYKTTENYLHHTNKRIIPHFGKMPISKIQTLHIIDYLNNLSNEGLGSATIVYNYRVLRSIFSKAVEWKVITKQSNPMDGVKKPKETPKVELSVYDEEESIELFKALEKEDFQFRILISLALTTGLRRAELLGLEWKNIDLTLGVINVVQSIPAFNKGTPVIKLPKNINSVRHVALSPSIHEELKNYRKEWLKEKAKNLKEWIVGKQEFLFCNKKGMPYYPKSIGDKWRSFHKRNEHIKYIRFHDLRHTSATLLINQGVHAKIISERLGHADIGTTMNVYGHVIRKADHKAAALFDDILAK